MAELTHRMGDIQTPLKSNRWVIKMNGGNVIEEIPQYCFSNFTLKTEKLEDGKKDALKLTLTVRNDVSFLLTPDMVIRNNKVKIDFLDPTGVEVNHYNMVVDFESLELIGDYGDDDILTHRVEFWVKDLQTITSKKQDKEVLKKYLENRENGKEEE